MQYFNSYFVARFVAYVFVVILLLLHFIIISGVARVIGAQGGLQFCRVQKS